MLDATLEKVAAASAKVADATRQVSNIADAASQLEHRSRLAQSGLEAKTIEEKERFLRQIVDHCPNAETIQSWREETENALADVSSQLSEIHEEIEKASALLEARTF